MYLNTAALLMAAPGSLICGLCTALHVAYSDQSIFFPGSSAPIRFFVSQSKFSKFMTTMELTSARRRRVPLYFFSAILLDLTATSLSLKACPLEYEEWRSVHRLSGPTDSSREVWYKRRCADLDAWNEASTSFLLGPNTRFIDRFPEEINAMRKPVETSKNGEVGSGLIFMRSEAADDGAFSSATKVDWRDAISNPQGVKAVTGIKNQGNCGACWAFSVLAALEGAVALGHSSANHNNQGGGSVRESVGESVGVLNDYSEQQLVDCDVSNGGCGGGSFNSAFKYLESSGGVSLYDDYPWASGSTGSPGECEAAAHPPAAGLTDYATVVGCNVEEAKRALFEVGVLTVSIDASCDSFSFYSSGLFDAGCGADGNDHAVALVGFVDASDPSNDLGADYFIAKNSWGTSWGVKGYMYLAATLADPSASAANCGVSNVLKQPLGVWPDSALALVNASFPPPLVPGNDDEDPGGGGNGGGDGGDGDDASVWCTNVVVNGDTLFDDDGKHANDDEKHYDKHKREWSCKAVEWLAAKHPWDVWVAFYAGLFVVLSLFAAALRCCCKRACRGCRAVLRCCCPCLFCCGSKDERDDEGYDGKERRRRDGGGHGGGGVVVVLHSHRQGGPHDDRRQPQSRQTQPRVPSNRQAEQQHAGFVGSVDEDRGRALREPLFSDEDRVEEVGVGERLDGDPGLPCAMVVADGEDAVF